MTGLSPSLNFREIRALGASQNEGFEEFCCQLARRYPDGLPCGEFRRLSGAGGDGGVECVWRWPSGEEWGWQAKYFFAFDRAQVDKSVKAALEVHPGLTRYYMCIPFDLTGPKKGKGGKIVRSQDDQFEESKQVWQAMAAARGMNVTFILWNATELRDRLLSIDPSHGRLRYWFGAEQFGDGWFRHQLEGAAEAARPRYSPELNVEVPIAAAFEALGCSPRWVMAIRALAARLDKAADEWADTYRALPSQLIDVRFPESQRDIAERLTSGVHELRDTLLQIPSSLDLTTILALVDAASADAASCLEAVTAAFADKYSLQDLDSANWRQFMTEYQASFPTHHVDTARDVVAALDEVRTWYEGVGGQLATASSLLVTGPAGAGKTHAICDIALDRHRRGLRSVVLLGQWFGDGDPWAGMRELLGLPGNLSRDAMLTALEVAGEVSGYPCIIFIDALNETVPRRIWHAHLERFVNEIKGRRWLRLCVTCRSTFREDVIDPALKLPTIEHTGFAAVEFDAFREFFNFYGLDIPAMPLMQPEFANPLFLQLVCESLRDSGRTRLPEGLLGISAVLDLLIAAKEQKLSAELDYFPKERLVQRAIAALIVAMSVGQTRSLPWAVARQIVDALRPSSNRSASLFDALLRENMLAEDRAVDPGSGAVLDVIRFAFERLADHLIIRDRLSTMAEPADIVVAFQPGGRLHFIVRDEAAARQQRGLLEALAIQLPEQFGIELPDASLDTSLWRMALDALIEGLAWRSPNSITTGTRSHLIGAVNDPQMHRQAFEALLAVGGRPANPVNADWFHGLLSSQPMAIRDEYWCPFLHLTFGEHKSVDRLIRWAGQEMPSDGDREVVRLWLVQLAWFCAANDRRVRDHATIAMVQLLEGRVDLCADVLSLLPDNDDDYVVERCVAACYAALIRVGSAEAVEAVAAALAPFFEEATLPQNASIRDYMRSIMEFAHLHEALPAGTNIAQFRPPYQSEWPLAWPTGAREEEYKATRADHPRLYASCIGDDFAVYTVPHALRDFDGLDLAAARRWIFQQVLDMGYTLGTLTRFDAYLVGKYGGGRGRVVWAERVGKKYQRIALARLVARVADHLPRKPDEWAPTLSTPPLLHEGGRDIDPTLLIKEAQDDGDVPSWWLPMDYDFARWEGTADEAWLKADDWPAGAIIELRDPATGKPWLLLDADRHWAAERANHREQPQRLLWLRVRSYFLPRERAEECMAWLGDAQVYGNEPGQCAFHEGFVGEYPWGLTFRQRIEEADAAGEDRTPLGAFGVVATAASFTPEHEDDCYHQEKLNLAMPAPVFFSELQLAWNGAGGYEYPPGQLALQDPALTTPGPSALLARRDFIEEFLHERELVLIWTVTAEKLWADSSSRTGERLEYTCAHMLDRGTIRSGTEVVGPRERRNTRRVAVAENNEPTTAYSASQSLAVSIALQLLERGPLSRVELATSLGMADDSSQLRTVLRALIAGNILALTIPEKPTSPRQSYQLISERVRATLCRALARSSASGSAAETEADRADVEANESCQT